MTRIECNSDRSIPYFKPIEFQENNSNKKGIKKALIAIGRSCDRYLYLGDKTKVFTPMSHSNATGSTKTLWTVKDVKSTAGHCKRTINKIFKIISFILVPVAPLVCSAIKLAYKYSYVRNKLSSVENLSASKIPNNEKLEDAIKHPLDQNILKTPRQQDKIDEGYGEYVVFQKGPGNTKRHISPQLFEKVYQIFQKYAPGALAIEYKDNLQEGLKKYENRYSLISHEIQLIDKNLEIAFIPRTLYELNFVKQTIKEDIKEGKACERLQESPSSLNKNCWHLPKFADNGALTSLHQQEVVDLAYRLNTLIVDKMPSTQSLTFEEIQKMTEKELLFFKKYYNSGNEKRLNGSHNSPAFYFSASAKSFKNFTNVKSIGIENEASAKILHKAVELECSPLAIKSIMIYRGANFEKDSIFNKDGDEALLSYGTGLLAGVIYDPGATALSYSLNEKNAYVHAVPFDMYHTAPFRLPTADILRQLHGHGEKFHVRSRAVKKENLTKSEWELWKTDLAKDKLVGLYQQFKDEAIQLKP